MHKHLSAVFGIDESVAIPSCSKQCPYSCKLTIGLHGDSNTHDSIISFRTMFPPCLTRMYEHHCAFLQRLEERLTNWKWQGLLGDVLQRVFDPTQVRNTFKIATYIDEFFLLLGVVRICS